MDNTNFGFTGAIPDNVSIQNNIDRAIQYQATHSDWETLYWFGNSGDSIHNYIFFPSE